MEFNHSHFSCPELPSFTGSAISLNSPRQLWPLTCAGRKDLSNLVKYHLIVVLFQICVKCKEPIKSSSVKHDGNSYHSECFVCSMCSQPLAGKPFTKHEGSNICQDCYRNSYAKRCAACQELIEGSVKFVAYDEKFFHRDCFTCSKCGLALAGEKFRVLSNEKVCINCSS